MGSPSKVGELIQKITPLYNSYTKNSKNIDGADALEIMRDIGAILSNFIEKEKVAPHNLYRQIYGKGEGTENIQQKSYITREFLGRCYRIYKIFPDKGEIKKDFPKLASFTLFREAMPFFDNPKYKLSGEERDKLLRLLNSSVPKSKILNEIRNLQKKYIGIKNPRTQKLSELDSLKGSFVNAYKHIKSLLGNGFNQIKEDLDNNNLSKETVKKISANINALTDDSFRMDVIEINDGMNEPWLSLVSSINEIAKEKTAKKRRRVRKIIDPVILVHISDMVIALSSEEYFNNYKQKHG